DAKSGTRGRNADPRRPDSAGEVEREPRHVARNALEPGIDQHRKVEPGDESAPVNLEAQTEQLDGPDDVPGRLRIQPAREQAHELAMRAWIDRARVLAPHRCGEQARDVSAKHQ